MHLAFLMAVGPILLLVYWMVKPLPMPSHRALPLTALLILLTVLLYRKMEWLPVTATLVSGVLTALTPITIIAGAMLLMRFMEKSGAQARVNEGLMAISPNPIARLMIVGWAFVFFLEGASGFGTPSAIAAPMLVSMGFSAVRSVLFTLSVGALAVSFGGVGMPMWFGFSQLSLESELLQKVAFEASLMNLVAGLFLPVFSLSLVVGWQKVKANLVFVLLSVLACTVPATIIASFSTEFPSLVGGFIGLVLTIFLAKMGWGLDPESHDHPHHTVKEVLEHPEIIEIPPSLIRAMMPLILLVVLLLITRIELLGIRPLLLNTDLLMSLETAFFSFRVSEGGIFIIEDILSTGINWEYKSLYVPALIPFVLVVLVMAPFLNQGQNLGRIFAETGTAMKKPAIAMVGALVMVRLMLLEGQGEELSQVKVIGQELAYLAGSSWQYAAPFLGALGAFFSGSGTVSNLTFGGVQLTIAEATGISQVKILALQMVGGSAGTMACINSVVAACAVVGVKGKEGQVIRMAILPLLLYLVVALLVSLFLA